MSKFGGWRSAGGLGALLLMVSLASGCSDDRGARAPVAAVRDPFRMVFFNSGPDSAYNRAIVAGAQARAEQLPLQVVLDVVNARGDPSTQLRQLREAIDSRKYLGGFILPIGSDELCDTATDRAPDKNFIVVVVQTPICGRVADDGEDAWAPGTLSFVSAGQQVSDFEYWGNYIRLHSPGPQSVLLLTGPSTAGQTQNAATALRAVEARHATFDLVDTVQIDPTAPDAATRVVDALAAHPKITIVASTDGEMTKAAVQALKQGGRSGVQVYDAGAGSTVLPLIRDGQVRMSMPYYPASMGATAVQALYDARIGRTPITRFHRIPMPPMQGAAPFVAVTRKNVDGFEQAGLSEY